MTDRALPWKVSNLTPFAIQGDDGQFICQMFYGSTEEDMRLAMARALFVKTAANAHDELVRRLRIVYVDRHFAAGHKIDWLKCENTLCFLNRKAIEDADGPLA